MAHPAFEIPPAFKQGVPMVGPLCSTHLDPPSNLSAFSATAMIAQNNSSNALIQLAALERAYRDEVAKKLNITVVGIVYKSKEKCMDGEDTSSLPSGGTNPAVSGSSPRELFLTDNMSAET